MIVETRPDHVWVFGEHMLAGAPLEDSRVIELGGIAVAYLRVQIMWPGVGQVAGGFDSRRLRGHARWMVRHVRELLASHYNIGDREPNIQAVRVDVKGDRSLTLQHIQHDRRPMGETTDEVLRHLHRLWGFPVHLESLWQDEVVATSSCPASAAAEEQTAA